VVPLGKHPSEARACVRVSVQKSRIPSNLDGHFGITCLMMQQIALSIFEH